MDIVVTKAAELDPRGIACRHCGKLLSIFDVATDIHTPPVAELVAAGAVAVPNFGWFCGQECADAYSREYGVAFQRDSSGKVSYY